MPLPNLIIIGAQKCGTTSLHYYLSRHPQISMSRQKELNFFISERNWPKGLSWYQSNFVGRADIYGEASPNYTYYPVFNGVAELMKSILPDAKLIYILRDPIERIISHYIHNYSEWREKQQREDRSFAEALSDPNLGSYVLRSRYYMQLEQYLPFYSRSQILIVTAEELSNRRRDTLRKIFGFLGVEESFDCPEFNQMKNRSADKQRSSALGTRLLRLGRRVLGNVQSDALAKIGNRLVAPVSQPVQRPILDEALRARLVAILQEDINCLRDYSGLAFEHWSL